MLTKASDDAHLEKAKGCPAWLVSNAGANGYYHATLGSGSTLRDGGKNLTLPELVGALGDVRALVRSGGMKPSAALAIVPEFAMHAERRVVDQDTAIAGLTEGTFMPADTWPSAASFIDRIFGPRARELGWEPRPSDNDEVRLLRHDLVRFAAGAGDDRELVQRAKDMAQRWLTDRKAINAGLLSDVLTVAAEHGDRDFFDKLHAVATSTHDRRERNAAIRALGSFRDPAISKDAMAVLLTKEFDAREAFFALLFGPLRYPETRALPFQFVKEHIDELMKRLPHEVGTDFAAGLPNVGSGFCNATQRDEVKAFFKDRVKNYVGGQRNLDQTIEKIDICIGERKAIEPDIARFLQTQ